MGRSFPRVAVMDTLTVDFETFYSKEYSLSKITTEEYINDPMFQVIGIAVKRNDEDTQWFSGTPKETKAWLAQFDWVNSMVIAHNAMFDGAILSWRFGIKPKAIICTLCMGRALLDVSVGGSLAKMSEYYQLGEKGTEVLNALGKRRADFTEAELTAYAGYCINDVELTYKLFYKMLPHFNKTELKLIDITTKMYTEPKLYLDAAMLDQHLHEVREQKDRLLAECGISKEDLMSNPKFAAVLEMFGVDVPTKISARTGKSSYAFAKTDEGFKELQEHSDPRVQAIVAARLGTKSTLEETRTQRFIEIAGRMGTLPVPLKYYGARTGRWAASDQINCQNIPRKSRLKEAIIAPEGYVIVGADLSNIELRVGLWLAGQMDKLTLLQNGVDLYKDFASSVFGVAYDEVTSEQRFIGKTSQLSLIFSVGAGKLRAALKAGSGVDIGEDEAKRIVSMYRSEYASVAAIWKEGEKVIEAIHNDVYMPFGFNNLLHVEGRTGIKLPSGLHLQFHSLHRRATDTGSEWAFLKARNQWDRLYGGKVFQGSVQSIARCVAGEAIVRVNKRYPVLLCIHDSIYTLVPESEADEGSAFLNESLTITPDWLPGIVLGAEGGWSKTLKGAG